jgi:hypothetical protein
MNGRALGAVCLARRGLDVVGCGHHHYRWTPQRANADGVRSPGEVTSR